jgi:hypothetical protein
VPVFGFIAAVVRLDGRIVVASEQHRRGGIDHVPDIERVPVEVVEHVVTPRGVVAEVVDLVERVGLRRIDDDVVDGNAHILRVEMAARRNGDCVRRAKLVGRHDGKRGIGDIDDARLHAAAASIAGVRVVPEGLDVAARNAGDLGHQDGIGWIGHIDDEEAALVVADERVLLVRLVIVVTPHVGDTGCSGQSEMTDERDVAERRESARSHREKREDCDEEKMCRAATASVACHR